MKRHYVSTIIAFAICVAALGQQSFGPKLNGGLSYFPRKTEPNLSRTYTDKCYPMLSGQGGLFYNFNLKNKFLIGADILFVPVFGKEYFKLLFIDSTGNLTGDFGEDNVYRHVYYLGLPVYFGYTIKKININLGFQANFNLNSGGKENGHTFYMGEDHTWTGKVGKLGINNYDYGIRVGMFYKLSDKFSIETNYYYGLTNLVKDKSFAEYSTWKVQQWTLGLRYNLLAHNNLP